MSLTVFCWVSWHRIAVDQYTCIWASAERYGLESFSSATTHCCKAGISKLSSTARQIEKNRDKTSVPERAVYGNMRNESQQRTREEWNTVKITLGKAEKNWTAELQHWMSVTDNPKEHQISEPDRDFADPSLSSPCVPPWHVPCLDTRGEDQHNRRLWLLQLQLWWEHRASKHWAEWPIVDQSSHGYVLIMFLLGSFNPLNTCASIGIRGGL